MSYSIRNIFSLWIFFGLVFVASLFAFSPVFAQTVETPPDTGEVPPNTDTPLPEETPPLDPVAEEIPIAEEVVEPDPSLEEEVTPEDPEVTYAVQKDQYTKYSLFLKYQKKQHYQKYVRYREIAYKYPWEASNKKIKKIKKSLQKDYKKYQKYLKNPSKNRKYAGLKSRYDDYRNFDSMRREYFSLKEYAGYAAYVQYDKSSYDAYADYGTDQYKAGYDQYRELMESGTVPQLTEEEVDGATLGPQIAVGIYNYTTSDLRESSIRIRANHGFDIYSKNDNFVATIPADVRVKIEYIGDKTFQFKNEATGEVIGEKRNEVKFRPVSGHEFDTIFDVNRPGSTFDRYRDGMRIRYYDSPDADGDRIWVINDILLEHYVWGMGEITGTGPAEYNRIMTTIYRTYGYWKLLYSTKYAPYGFKVDATSGSQIYYGYDWEVGHDAIRQAAEATRGRIVKYENEPALTPYSSWTDGKTRRYEDGHWGHDCNGDGEKISSVYPWLSEASDSWGKHPSLSTCELAERGNHMVGLSANGALNRSKEGIGYFDTLTHYYRGVTVNPEY